MAGETSDLSMPGRNQRDESAHADKKEKRKTNASGLNAAKLADRTHCDV